MSDKPTVSMSSIPEDRWEAIFGPAKPVGRDTGEPARLFPVALPAAVAERMDDATARDTMDRMAGRLVAQGLDAGEARQIARQSALRADARLHHRPHGHITTRKEG